MGKTSPIKLILASASPRRKELLRLFGIPFTVRAADIDETMNPENSPREEVEKVSRRKALAIARDPDEVVIAADTIVVCDNRILGKPKSREEAVSMLKLLSGRDHQVMTGCTLLYGQAIRSFVEVTDLHFRRLTDGEIRRYVETGEPMDKAGAYGIQGGAALFCEKLRGDYYNVVGLPVCRLWETLRELVPECVED